MLLVTGAVTLSWRDDAGTLHHTVGTREFPLAIAPFPGLAVYGLMAAAGHALHVRDVGVDAGAEGRVVVGFGPRVGDGPVLGEVMALFDDQWRWSVAGDAGPDSALTPGDDGVA
jgi:hypothetical protein